MTKGTYSKGKHSRGYTHILCRRCGKRSFHAAHGVCASCGFGKTAKIRSYSWQTKKGGKRLK